MAEKDKIKELHVTDTGTETQGDRSVLSIFYKVEYGDRNMGIETRDSGGDRDRHGASEFRFF